MKDNAEKKEKKGRAGIGKIVFGLLALVIAAGAMAALLFQTKEIKVTGNEYYGPTSVRTWIQRDELSASSLYIWAKFNYMNPELPHGIERIRIRLKTPWTVLAQVKEKDLIGYVDYGESRLYFDREGTVCLNTKRNMEGVPHIEGLSYDAGTAEVGKQLPVEDDRVFRNLVELSKYLGKYELVPDRMAYLDSGAAVYFQGVEVLLGKSDYDERLAQVPPILEKLSEQYPQGEGTLHLEDYEASSSSIRFVPKK